MSFDTGLALTTVHLSRGVYGTPERGRQTAAEFGLGGFAPFSGPSTQAFVAEDALRRYLVFRGTEATNPTDWMRNAEFRPVEGALGARIHSGFRRALDEVWVDVFPMVSGDDKDLVITGHSLGAGLATVAAARLVAAGLSVDDLYLYGSPRVGLGDFASAFDDALGVATYRIINHIDLVARVPLLVQGYRHVGRRMYFDGAGRFHPDAGAWQIAKDDLMARVRGFGRISVLGVTPHEISRYVERIESIQ